MALSTDIRLVKEFVTQTEALATADGVWGVIPHGLDINVQGEDSVDENVVNTITNAFDIVAMRAQVVMHETLQHGPVTDDKEKRNVVIRCALLRALRAFRDTHFLCPSATETKQYSSYWVWSPEGLMVAQTSGIRPAALQAFDNESIMVQVKSGIMPNGEVTYSVMVSIDAEPVLRVASQPMSKVLIALIKAMRMPDAKVLNQSDVQANLVALNELRPEDSLLYWYITNTKIAQKYIMFRQYRNVDSCMAKDHAFYNGTGPRQHPMDCYNDSPDWRLMMLSRQSPEQIMEFISRVEALISEDNTRAAEMLFRNEFPFLTRCMVLPHSKELTGYRLNSNNKHRPQYVFGKMYGVEKYITRFCQSTNHGERCDNALMHQRESIAGGRIKALASTREDYCEDLDNRRRAHLLLPYFDRANRAALIKDSDGQLWWESTYPDFYRSGRANQHNAPGVIIAGADYRSGLCAMDAYLSPATATWSDLGNSTYRNMTSFVETPLGFETGRRIAEYYSHVNGVALPKRMLTQHNGSQVLACSLIMPEGSTRRYTHAELEALPEQFTQVNGTWFDIQTQLGTVLLQAMQATSA